MKFQKFPFKIEKQYRLIGYNYSENGYYFITICTKDRENYFGHIQNNSIKLSPIGKIVDKFWIQLPNKFNNIKLGEYCIMPNHLHGILIICRNAPRNGRVPLPSNNGRVPLLSNNGRVPLLSNNGRVPLNNNNNNNNNNNSMNAPVLRPWRVPTNDTTIKPLDKNSISSIINHFKGSVKRSCQVNNLKFVWQSRFHDRIIRNEREYFAIKRYILNNPKNWEKDRNNSFSS